ncbi:FMN-linked oxidoreductase [Rhizopogon vinicolor AM-OR11-026]|nr:FMN-linked oxidoreductase [Rhizopogon vinicolor AM-OR11-026]
MGTSDPMPQFTYLVRQLKKHNLAYLHVVEPRVSGNADVDAPPESTNDLLRQIWCGEDKDSVFISAGGYTRQTAIETAEEKGGMVAFGRLYIPNPDLPIRLMHDLQVATYDRATFYIPGDYTGRGYTDFPGADDVPTGTVPAAKL